MTDKYIDQIAQDSDQQVGGWICKWRSLSKSKKDKWEYLVGFVAAHERERLCCILDAEHEKRKHMDNHAAYFAKMLRDSAK